MRVVLDASLTASMHMTGIGTYVIGLSGALARAGVETIVWDRTGRWGHPLPGSGLRRGVVRKAVYLAWLNAGAPRRLQHCKPDVAHFLNFVTPIGQTRKPCPYVTTIHDVHVLTMKGVRPLYRAYRHALLRLSVATADAIIVPSRFVKQELISLWPDAASKVTVVYHGGGERFRVAEADVLPFERRRHFLAVGPLDWRKNHEVLIRAYAKLSGGPSPLSYPLIVTGDLRDKASARIDELVRRYGLEGKVQLVGHVSEGELRRLYREAIALVFPSRHEGFGLPCVEAMSSGTPVIAANVSAIPEVVGEAGILVDDPGNSEGFAGAMQLLMADREEWWRRVKLGLKEASRYSWDQAAKGTIAVYERVLEEARSGRNVKRAWRDSGLPIPEEERRA